MLFNSFLFILAFFPAVLLTYWLIARGRAFLAASAWLLLASYLFYIFGETTYPWLLLASIAFNFLAGHAITRRSGAARKRMLILGVAVDLAALAYFKYSDFGVEQLAALGLPHPANWNVVLPVGISFFTFTQIAYLADIYAGKTTSPDPVRYGLFVSYFPHLIAGPILHNKEMIPQFQAPNRRTVGVNLYAGLAMFAIGLAKKVLLADTSGGIATGLFSSAASSPPGFFMAWLAATAYALQIYFDFSGYSDMAIGMSRMLGVNLPINFNSPYKSRSIIDFWRRWHITLSRFLRDYLYIPLGGNRRGEARRFLNLFVTMLLGGIWHGAGWTFVIWGAMHGAAQTVAHGWTAIGRKIPLPRIPFLLGWALTMAFVLVAWVPFRAPDLHVTAEIWRGMLGLAGPGFPSIGPLSFMSRVFGPLAPVTFKAPEFAVVVVAAVIALFAPNSQQLLRPFQIGLDSPSYQAHGTPIRQPLRLNWTSAAIVGLVLGIAMRFIGGYSEFIYFQF